jgi:glutathione reductase (NADPH)
MASNSYDLLILGGGNAGFGVTVPTRKSGLKVALVEERDFGGTCPNQWLHAQEGAGCRGPRASRN